MLHASQQLEPMAGTDSVVGFGYTGVGFFFVLSGFVLAWSRNPGLSKGQFYWRRFARVWPLHALTTLLAVPVALFTGAGLAWAALPFVLTMTQSWAPPGELRYAFNGVSWSLSCEVFFYLLFPALVGPISQRIRLMPAIAGAFLAMGVLGAIGVIALPSEVLGYLFYTMPPFRLGEFIIGICLALALQRGWRPRFTVGQALVGAVLMYAVLMAGMLLTFGEPARLPYVVADLWMLPSFMAIIVAAAAGDINNDGGFLRSSVLVRLGQWSFALYLIHELILKTAGLWVDSLNPGMGAFAALVVVAVAVGASGVLYEWFERPVESRLRKWGNSRAATKVDVRV
ncbi:acyltransferase [Kocuria rosea]|nr:acyltransferase [Kocuria polaris]